MAWLVLGHIFISYKSFCCGKNDYKRSWFAEHTGATCLNALIYAHWMRLTSKLGHRTKLSMKRPIECVLNLDRFLKLFTYEAVTDGCLFLCRQIFAIQNTT